MSFLGYEHRDKRCSDRDAASASRIDPHVQPIAVFILHEALRRVLAWEVYLPEQIGKNERLSSKPAFSPRQLEVVRGLSRGLPTKSIARELNLSEHTVREYIATIFRSLNVHNRTEAVIKVSRLGMLVDWSAS